MVILCSGVNCAGTCDFLTGPDQNVCYSIPLNNNVSEYGSIMAYVCFYCLSTYQVYMATAGCAESVQLEHNVCYNTSYDGMLGYYQTFYILS
ncbi:hypothetical protein SCP_1900340 [Sparassis crispa]|uniref:Uncharacterized protein n=1 Tax=Sparassis crispa TaxID=139825 RepID=A0A401H6X4_9APHY|nr:hypothetical protein SCP_1900340 [Sparassis crispa]GBE90185.1 hypothetical protein SCP_1900340 [Sparassis crispa]